MQTISHASGCVSEQVTERDGVSFRRIVGEELRQVIFEGELALLDQTHNRGGGELLGDGADPENRVDVRNHVVLDLGSTVPSCEQDLTVSCDGD